MKKCRTMFFLLVSFFLFAVALAESGDETSNIVVDLAELSWSWECDKIAVSPKDTSNIGKDTVLYDGASQTVYTVENVEKNDSGILLTVKKADMTTSPVSGSYHYEKSEKVVPSLLSVGKDVTLLKTPTVNDDQEIRIPLSYKVGLATVQLTVTYKAEADYKYDYTDTIVPSGFMNLRETLTISVKTTGSFNLLQIEPVSTKNGFDLMTLGLNSSSFVGVKGSFSLTVSSKLVGNFTYTMVREKGCRILGDDADVIDVDVDQRVTDFELSGEFYAGLEGKVGLNIPVLGEVCSISASLGLKIGVEPQTQYDSLINCYNVPVTLSSELNVKAKVALSMPKGSFLNGFNWTLYEKSVSLFKGETQLCIGHFELVPRKDRDELLPEVLQASLADKKVYAPSDVHWRGFLHITDPKENDRVDAELCTVPAEDRRTVKYSTGTREKIEDSHTVVGQLVKKPNNPTNINDQVIFLGWFTDPIEGNEYDFTKTITVETEPVITLYAHWSEPYRRVTVDLNVPGSQPTEQLCPPGVRIDAPVVPFRMQYHFLGFQYSYVNESGEICTGEWSFNRDKIPDCDITIRGMWEYDLDYNPFEAGIKKISEDSNYWNTIDTIFTYSVNYNTGMIGTIAGRVSVDYFDKLYPVVHITGYTGGSSIVMIPERLNGQPVTYVDGSSFPNKESVIGLILPATVQVIKGFQDFPNLQYVYFMSNPVECQLSGNANVTFAGISLIEADCFKGCSKLTNVVIPTTIQYIGTSAFANTGLQDISFDFEKRLTLGTGIFEGCTQLRSAHLPQSFSILPERTFYGCSSLKDIDLSGFDVFEDYCLRGTGIEKFDAKNINHLGEYVLADMLELTEIDMSFSAELTSVFDQTCYLFNCPKLKDASIFGLRKFEMFSCPILEKINLGTVGDIVSIENWDDCPKLKSIRVWGNVIEANLQNFDYLETVEITGNVESVILQNLPSLCKASFSDEVNSLIGINLPELVSLHFGNLKKSYYYTPQLQLNNCPKLKEIDGALEPGVKTSFIDMPFAELDLSVFPCITQLENLPNLRELDLSVLGNNAGSKISLANLPKLSCLTLPVDSDIGLSIKDCPNLQTLIAPSELDCVRLSNLQYDQFGNGICRVVINGSATTMDAPLFMDRLYVVIAPEESPIRQSMADVAAVGFLTPQEAAQGIYLLVVCSDYNSILSDAQSGQTASYGEMMWLKRHVGDSLKLPSIQTMNISSNFMGWYVGYNDYWTKTDVLRFNNMPMRDLRLYPCFSETLSHFSFVFNDDGTACVTDYQGESDTVYVPEQVAQYHVIDIDDKAFVGKTITKIYLPTSFSVFEPQIFRSVPMLTDIEINNERYCSIDGAVYEKNDDGEPATLVFCPSGMTGTLVIPQTVTTIAPDAICNCMSLDTIIFSQDMQLADDAISGSNHFEMFGPTMAENLTAWCAKHLVPYNQYTLTICLEDRNVQQNICAGTSLESFTLVDEFGRKFEGWTTEPQGNDRTFIYEMPDKDTIVWPVWKVLYDLTEDGALTEVDEAMGDIVVVPDGTCRINKGAINYPCEKIVLPASICEIEDNAFVGFPTIVAEPDSYAEMWAIDHNLTFEVRTYCLHFETNGGEKIEDIHYSAEDVPTLPIPVRTWSDFMGWYMDEELTIPLDGNDLPHADGCLFAAWTVHQELEFRWSDNEDGSVTLTGYTGKDPLPVVPDHINGKPVTSIADYAFANDSTLYQITLPCTISRIGDYAFYGSEIHNIFLPDGNIQLGTQAFGNCKQLISIDIPEGIVELPDSLLRNCTSLAAVTLPDSLEVIGQNLINGCTMLKMIHIPAGVQGLDADCFENSSIKMLTVAEENPYFAASDNVLYSKDKTKLIYACNGICQLVIPDSVNEIMAKAFYQHRTLREITLPDTLITVGDKAFQDTNLEQVRIPDSLAKAGDYAFPLGTELQVTSNTALAYNTLLGRFYVTTLNNIVYAETLKLDVHELSIPVGKTAELSAIVLPANANNYVVRWYSADPDIAVVDEGSVQAIGLGRTYVFGYTDQGLQDACVITVEAGCDLSCELERPHLWCNAPAQLKTICSDKRMNISYESDNENVIVSTSGIITSHQPCTCTVTVTASFEETIYAVVTVDITCLYPAQSFDLSYCMDSVEENGHIIYVTDGYQNIYLEDAISPSYNLDYSSVIVKSSSPEVIEAVFDEAGYHKGWRLVPGIWDGYITLEVTLLASNEKQYYSLRVGTPEETGEWTEPKYRWAEDRSYVTAVMVNIYDPAQTVEERVPAHAKVVTAPDRYGFGQYSYVSDQFINSAFEVQMEMIRMIQPLSWLDTLWLPTQLTTVCEECCMGLPCEAVILPDGCSVIESKAFANCDELIYISVPKGAVIAEDAFENCGEIMIQYR